MTFRKNEIIDAEFTTVAEEEAPSEVAGAVGINLDDVGYGVFIGRYKNGVEFVEFINFDDVVLGKGLVSYGLEYIKMIEASAIARRLTAKELANGAAEGNNS